MRLLRWASTAAVVLAAALPSIGSAAPATAAEGGEFSLRPVRPAGAAPRDRSYVVRTVRAGAELTDRLEAVNLTDAPLDLALAPVDATVLADGSFAPGTAATGDGSWLTVTPTRVRVPARGTTAVELRIRVPADAPHGDHIAAVVAQRADGAARPDPANSNVRVVQRVGVRTYLTVEPRPGQPAHRRAFEFRDLRFVGGPEGRLFEADIANVGTLLIEPLGTLTVARGGLSASIDVPVLGTVPVGESRRLKAAASQRLEPGTYEATLRLHDVTGGPEQQRTISFTVGADNSIVPAPVAPPDASDDDEGSAFPWWIAVLALLILLAVAVAVWQRRRRQVQEGDTPSDADAATA